MEKAKRSLVRVERIDGVNVASGLIGDDYDELLAMIGDALAYWLFDRPKEWRKARKMMRRVIRDWRPEPWYSGLVDFWRGRWKSGIIGAAVLTGAIYAVSYVVHWLGAV